MTKSLTYVFLMAFCYSASAQQENIDLIEEIVENRIDNISEGDNSDPVLIESYRNELKKKIRNKIRLDIEGLEEVKDLQLIGLDELKFLSEHIIAYGPILEIEELYMVGNLEETTIERLIPFVRFGDEINEYANQVDRRTNYQIRIRSGKTIQESRGYSENDFQGDAWSQNVLFRLNHLDWIEGGINLEKDAGEKCVERSSLPFDHRSGFLKINSKSFLRSVIIGDYVVGFGQGLTYSLSNAPRKSEQVLYIHQNKSVIRPYSSMNEFYFLRGICSELQFKTFQIVAFHSQRRLDANGNQGGDFTSFYTSGLHRTTLENDKLNAVRIRSSGISGEFQIKQTKIGVITVVEDFSHRKISSQDVSKVFETWERNQIRKGIYFKHEGTNFTAFGELSSDHQSESFILGTIIMPYSRFGYSISIRYLNFGNNSFSRSSFGSRNSNERGIYQGFEWKLSRRVKMGAYIDNYESIWPRSDEIQTSSNQDYLLSLNWKKGKNEILIRFKWKEEEKSIALESLMERTGIQNSRNIRCQYISYPHPNWRFRSRIEFTEKILADSSHQGSLFFQEFKFKKIQSPFSFLTRFTLFNTENYNSRIYAYEQDVEGIFSVLPFYGKGSRIMFLCGYKLSRTMKLTFKISHTEYDDRNTIGSGLDEINEPVKTDIRMQLIWKI